MDKLKTIKISLALKLIFLIVVLVFIYPKLKLKQNQFSTRKEIVNVPYVDTKQNSPKQKDTKPSQKISEKILDEEKKKEDTKHNPKEFPQTKEPVKVSNVGERNDEKISPSKITKNSEKKNPEEKTIKKSGSNSTVSKQSATAKKKSPFGDITPSLGEIEEMFIQSEKISQISQNDILTGKKIIPSQEDIEHFYEETSKYVKK